MRLTRNDSPELAALEYQLLKDYPDDSIITPVILSRATDMIARQNYNQAYILLNELIEDFPDTKSTTQAKKIMEKLKEKKEIN
jgi:TolA-binding protein